MAGKLLTSTAINNWLQDKLSNSQKMEEVHDRFLNSTNDSEAFVWTLGADGNESFEFLFGVDSDLYFSLGRVYINVTANVEVSRSYDVLSVTLSGEVADVYDFDYDAEYEAATVQSGYDTLGNAGRVILSDIEFLDSEIRNFQFHF